MTIQKYRFQKYFEGQFFEDMFLWKYMFVERNKSTVFFHGKLNYRFDGKDDKFSKDKFL